MSWSQLDPAYEAMRVNPEFAAAEMCRLLNSSDLGGERLARAIHALEVLANAAGIDKAKWFMIRRRTGLGRRR